MCFCDGDRAEYLRLMAEHGGGAARMADEKKRLQRQIDATDRRIDQQPRSGARM